MNSERSTVNSERKELVILAGLSGAGRSVAAGAFEDLGWFVIDNLPVSLVPKVAELAIADTRKKARVALVMHGYDEDMAEQVEALRTTIDDVRVVFLDASDDALIRRYESTKRRHPLLEGDGTLSEAIGEERQRLGRAKAAADLVIDTSSLNLHQLREQLNAHFAEGAPSEAMRVAITSFGFKNGLPLDVDMVIDCRFLPNPHWDEELRPFSGQDDVVQEYVLERNITQRFLDRLLDLLEELLPAYVDEGKAYFTVAFGCTGGRHRSVAVAETVAARLKDSGWMPRVSHRDIDR